jgi:FkbM family methyltransferase
MHELNAIHEVFIDRHYDVGLGEDPKTILDLGANSGVATAYLAMRFPRAVIHAVEADPAMAALLAENVAGLPRVHVHHLAVGAKDGETCFFTDAGRPLSSSIRRRSPAQVEVRVPCRTLDTLLDELGLDEVDLVKFDIEGAEGLVFPGSEAARRRIRRAVGELHLRVPGCGRDAVVSAFGDARRVSVICSDDEHELVDIRPTAA